MTPRLIIAALVASLLALAVGCGAPAPEPPSPPTAAAPPATDLPAAQEPSVDALRAYLATRVLEVGSQRVAFVLTTEKALVNASTAQIIVTPADGSTAAAPLTAGFHEWPYGVRGSYATEIEFPSAGKYVITATVSDNSVMGSATIPVEVLGQSPVPFLGDLAPRSNTKTISEGDDLAEITTSYTPDPELYQLSIADAVDSGRPAVIVFATPAFCTSPTCGPQVDTVSELRSAHPDAASYIHVELYDNPNEIQGDPDNAQLVGTADEWGFTQLDHWTNESWVFILDVDGIVRHRFEGFATFNELEAALMDVAQR